MTWPRICPRCTSRMRHVWACHWAECELCGHTITAETVLRRAASRRGRLFLWGLR